MKIHRVIFWIKKPRFQNSFSFKELAKRHHAPATLCPNRVRRVPRNFGRHGGPGGRMFLVHGAGVREGPGRLQRGVWLLRRNNVGHALTLPSVRSPPCFLVMMLANAGSGRSPCPGILVVVAPSS